MLSVFTEASLASEEAQIIYQYRHTSFESSLWHCTRIHPSKPYHPSFRRNGYLWHYLSGRRCESWLRFRSGTSRPTSFFSVFPDWKGCWVCYSLLFVHGSSSTCMVLDSRYSIYMRVLNACDNIIKFEYASILWSSLSLTLVFKKTPGSFLKAEHFQIAPDQIKETDLLFCRTCENEARNKIILDMFKLHEVPRVQIFVKNEFSSSRYMMCYIHRASNFKENGGVEAEDENSKALEARISSTGWLPLAFLFQLRLLAYQEESKWVCPIPQCAEFFDRESKLLYVRRIGHYSFLSLNL